MKCPTCESELHRILYESVPVFRCLKCHGYLLAEKRLEGIRRSPATDIEQLKREVIAESQPDTEKRIRCPRCRRWMNKRHIPKPADLDIDICRDCRYVWLDGGELGRLQLSHEMTPKAQETRRFRQRQRTMTDEERAEFEENLEALPDEKAQPSLLWEMFFGRRHDGIW